MLVFVGLCLSAKAQINLEHTFNNEHVFYENRFDVELFHCTNNNQIKLYNTDYSLYKTVNITPPIGYTFSGGFNFSKKLFNDDNKIEFTANFFKNEGGIIYYNIRLYNEDGTMLKDFGEHPYTIIASVIKINEQYKLSIYKYATPSVNAITEIYSLPGTLPSNPTEPINNSSTSYNQLQTAYPNPANAVITLPYQLKQGEFSTMHIYNTNGQLIETKQIGYDFDKILLNVSGYTKGVYFYEVNGVSNKFIVE